MVLPVVGLTGGIASGKSTVAAMFAEWGVEIVDADALAREVVAPGTAGLSEVIAAFGEEFLLADGTLDRKALGDRVFANPDLRAQLNAILHPKIASLSAERIAGCKGNHAPYVIYEAALLVENAIHRNLASLIVVAVALETQIRRLCRRDAITETTARRRLDAQLPLQSKIDAAEHVIWNDGTIAETKEQAAQVHGKLVDRFSSKA